MSDFEHDVTNLPQGDVDEALRVAPQFSDLATELGSHTRRYFDALRALGRSDLTLARVIEPHVDALGILAQAGRTPADLGASPDDVWGVYASRSTNLTAEERDGAWVITGEKPWCSLGTQIAWALITVGTPQGQRLFAVDLRHQSVSSVEQPWVSRGLAGIRSTSLSFDSVPAEPVGEPGFYLNRDGFAWGGIGVAAIWGGAAEALHHTVREGVAARQPDQIALMHLGRLDALCHVADITLKDAADAIDGGNARGQEGLLLATRVRAIIADCAEQALTITGHALGPGPLTANETHARRVADLTVYLRQHHAERDLAALGSMICDHG